VEILSPAKVNLFLHVTGRRRDGYHQLKSAMCRISLCDGVRLRFDRPGIGVRCAHPQVPCDKRNLAYRAARAFFARCGLEEKVLIEIEKNIPVAGGLGGGSSNAASVLMALNEHYHQPLSTENLMRLGAAIGADVPFFLFQAPALATGIGDVLEAIESVRPYQILIVNTGVSVSTRRVYQKLNLALTNCEKKSTKPLLKTQLFDAADHLCNDLESVTLEAYPEIATVKGMLIRTGAQGALMSGSGPSVFGLFAAEDDAKRAMKVLGAQTTWHIFLGTLLVNPIELVVKR
jgi:4-diphosphocytidyl-2-C-methyl-D-erythritol kinase